jgi:hypothetical protein
MEPGMGIGYGQVVTGFLKSYLRQKGESEDAQYYQENHPFRRVASCGIDCSQD